MHSGKGYGRSVLAALVNYLLGEGIQPIYMVRPIMLPLFAWPAVWVSLTAAGGSGCCTPPETIRQPAREIDVKSYLPIDATS
jgi:hypothetical protein